MDREEYEQTVMTLKDRVHGLAFWMLRDAEEARDVAQESLVRLWSHRERVRTDTARSWLLRTAHNLAVDRMRRRAARPEVDGDNLVLRDEDNPDPERSAHAGQLGSAIAKALGRLSERDRSVVILREVQGLSYGEIAETLDLPLGTLKAMLHRARNRLRRELVTAGIRP